MDWNKLGNALSGMGAGFQGRGSEWRYNQMASRQMQQEQEQQRREAEAAMREQFMQDSAVNNRIFLDHLKSGRVKDAFAVADQGIGQAQQMGQDPSVWQKRLEWLGGGMVTKALEDAEVDDREFELRGLLEPIGGAGQAPAGVQEMEYIRKILKNPDDFNPEYVKYARIKAGLEPRAGMSAEERIALNPDLTTAVAESGATIAGAETASKKVSEGTESRRTERINLGYDSAKGLATAKRGLDLLKSVQTGGIDAIDIKTRQALGLETADQGELSNLLGKAVLSQLRETFGAQFTEREGRLLMDIEAGIGKNNKTNMRLLNQLVQKSERYAKRAIDDAIAVEDYATAAEIKELLDFQLSDDNWLGAKSSAPTVSSQAEFDALPSGAIYIEDGKQYRKP